MGELAEGGVSLVITSPPYPMIEMWDESFSRMDPEVAVALREGNGTRAFGLMHAALDPVWSECYRVLQPGGFMCVNIGDATRKVLANFRLYTNHARITSYCESLGFQSLPAILWRKQTNAPNKFMGSGMLPCGAYVTLEHEYVLVFRKGDKRNSADLPAEQRWSSALFWEERNAWFSDVWDLKGTRQALGGGETRGRSAAFPFDLPYRLVNMYSMQGDTVLDPFLGTGTTIAACLACARNTVGYEIDPNLSKVIEESVVKAAKSVDSVVSERLASHTRFIGESELRRGSPLGYTNEVYGFRVMTKQETKIRLLSLDSIRAEGEGRFSASHSIAMPNTNHQVTLDLGNDCRFAEDQLPLRFADQ